MYDIEVTLVHHSYHYGITKKKKKLNKLVHLKITFYHKLYFLSLVTKSSETRD